jgi:alpha-glucosidase
VTRQDGARCSRREFLTAALAARALSSGWPNAARLGEPFLRSEARADLVRVVSPDGRVEFQLAWREQPQLSYRVAFRGRTTLESSPIGIMVDGLDLGRGAEVVGADEYRVNETYAWRGVHSRATNRCRGASIALRHVPSATEYRLEVRCFDDGIAFRYVVPGNGDRVVDEMTAFVLPAGSTLWYHDLSGHYESAHVRKEIADVGPGEWAAPPATFKLPDGAGYASITEAAVIHYSGMALQADGRRGVRLRLGHSHPPNHPFTLRYGQAEAERLARPAAIAGTITTPWRVVMLGADLNALVNCDMVHNLSPAPDSRLFPQGLHTDWLKPGRAVWKYLDGGGPNTLETMKEFSRLAAELGFEYNLVEGFWQRWNESELRELIEYSRQRNVGIWLWKHSRDIREPEARAAFFRHAQRVGAAGVKLDFFDHEAKEVMDLYQAALQEAAAHRLMVNFHGANKPTGESRTWPNELTREAVSGMERRSMPAWSVHDTTIPFTRMLAGHLDFTPMLFGERRRETSWAHQIATAAMFTSPLLVYGAHPRTILEHPAVELIKAIPSVWDETRVLPISEIGELAALARRHGKQWFLVIANGPTARPVEVSLSFLGRGSHEGVLVRDGTEDAAAVRVEHVNLRRTDTLSIELRAGGGFVARFA